MFTVMNNDFRISEILKEKGMTQTDLAALIGISRVGLSKAINGNTTIATLRKIAAGLGVDITELFAKRGDFLAFIDHRGKLYRCDSIDENRALLDRLEAKQSGK